MVLRLRVLACFHVLAQMTLVASISEQHSMLAAHGKLSAEKEMRAAPKTGASAAKHRPTKIAWWHPEKTGTSFGTALVHLANESLPDDVSMPTAREIFMGEHVVATGDFTWDYPPNVWFRNVFWQKYAFGEHRHICDSDWDEYGDAFFGLMRHPNRHRASFYLGKVLRFGNFDPNGLPLETNAYNDQLFLETAKQRLGYLTKYLTCKDDAYVLTTMDLEKAKDRLRNFTFVGLTDEYGASMCLLHTIYNTSCLPVELANMRPSVSKAPHARKLTTSALAGWLGERYHDPFDSVIYNDAVDRVKADIEVWGMTPSSCMARGCEVPSSSYWLFGS